MGPGNSRSAFTLRSSSVMRGPDSARKVKFRLGEFPPCTRSRRTPPVIHFSVMETIGCGTAIVTPFKADGTLDEAALRTHVNWQIDSGIDFLVACGSTGEAATLDAGEGLTGRHLNR